MINTFKAYLRLIKKEINQRYYSNFTNILYVTLDPAFAFEYINAMRKQYPEYEFRVIVPIINEIQPDYEKTAITFNIFSQNQIAEVSVYKLPPNSNNIQVYGLYMPVFSNCKDINEFAKLPYLAAFLKSVRIAIKKFSTEKFIPNIIHSESIPFFLGSEFDKNFPSNIKVLQIIKDFTRVDLAKTEAFWAAINIADEEAMKKICRDKVIKKCIAALFKLHNTRHFYKMRECLKFIYKNYSKFRKYIDKGDDIEENVIFNKLNSRITEIFPELNCGDNQLFNPYISTLEHTNFWSVTSKTYYEEIFNKPIISGNIYPFITKTKNKSSFISYGLNTDKYSFSSPDDVYQPFDVDNFRELRSKNKSAILKELTSNRIKTNFVDASLFQDEPAIIGFLDGFYDAPLIFIHTNCEVFANGVDISFNTILKLFELHKNIQVIFCIKDGLKNNFIKSWIEFLQTKQYLDGKWIFIDGDIKLSKFYSAADITLIPRRSNLNSTEHFIAMHYGCVPVAARSGILNDTIHDIFDDMTNGCGLKTKTGLLTEEDNNKLFLTPVIKALNIYQQNPSSWNLLIKNCLQKDCSWSFDILEKYNRIYQKLL